MSRLIAHLFKTVTEFSILIMPQSTNDIWQFTYLMCIYATAKTIFKRIPAYKNVYQKWPDNRKIEAQDTSKI